MRFTFFFACSLVTFQSFAQSEKVIQKSWIKTSIENLSNRELDLDSLYLRYSFQNSMLNISFCPAWNEFSQPWSLSDKELTIGFEKLKVEELTDSSLVIATEGVRRIKFIAEEYLSGQNRNLISAGEYKGKPLYEANQFVTPRYEGEQSLRERILKGATERFNYKTVADFKASFVVTVDGKIENIKVIKGITEDFDKQIVVAISNTSGDWRPAFFKGQPIQTEMFYDLRY